jgi:4-aminobutyrate aminotransferase-like enzyme/Ser/Thr protein kinase RdoA (MazF antagonist)
MAGFDFFRSPGLPTPEVSPEQARALAAELFGLRGTSRSLGSQQDANFMITSGTQRFVLKISNPAFHADELGAQTLAMEHLRAADPQLRVPHAHPGLNGETTQVAVVDGQRLSIRLLTYVEGEPLSTTGYLSPTAVASLGSVAGRLVRALRTFEDPGTVRVLQWDLQVADRVVELLAGHVSDTARRQLVLDATHRAAAELAPLRDSLPRQVIHGDATDDNVVIDQVSGSQQHGVIDFGDLMQSWAVAELAVTCSGVLRHTPDELTAVLPAIRAFHQLRPLARDEAEALWPLVVLRAAVLVVSGQQQAQLDRANDYVQSSLEPEWAIFARATAAPLAVMTHLILDDLFGDQPRTVARTSSRALLPSVPASSIGRLDFTVTSDDLHDGRFLLLDIEESVARETLESARVAITEFGAARLTRTVLNEPGVPATIALGVDVFLAAPVELCAPWDGQISRHADGLALRGGEFTLWLTGAISNPVDDGAIKAGTTLGSTADRLLVQLAAGLDERPPAFTTPGLRSAWMSLLLDPTFLLGVETLTGTRSDASELVARRDAALAGVQEHYYQNPPEIERGWRRHLFDTDGRAYLDMLNNVSILGHGEPRLAVVAYRQWRLLNTNSRFNYSAIVEYSERLAALAPHPLDTVFLVNSGTEAVDLALRLAWSKTGRRDIVAVQEAYHGWSDATDAISTSVADNPNALTTRPPWVHTVAAPNSYRGQYRGAEASRYADDATSKIDALAHSGRPPAAFVGEAFYGNAGGIALPDGYLDQVYGSIRKYGGVCIADEVQVGFGRLGRFFWGFEQQRVIPDIVTVAKAVGNGHPLGAVITTREIAEAYRSQGYFFSSAGGSPVSSQIGLVVLDVLASDQLQRNAEVVGRHLRAALLELGERHALIGAVHGLGLYIGVELVRDRLTLEPADTETTAICERLLQLGVVLQPTSDRMCVLKIKPPLGLTIAEADFFVAMLDRALSGN